jgi:hypothetical protein
MTRKIKHASTNFDKMEVDAVLFGVDFPATRDELVDVAKFVDTDKAIITLFESLPNTIYATRNEVKRTIDDRNHVQGGEDIS